MAGLEATPGDRRYAFALYNLGGALRDSGQPAEAIPYLERRLEVSPGDRSGIVCETLAAARREAGQPAPLPEVCGGGKRKGKGKGANKG